MTNTVRKMSEWLSVLMGIGFLFGGGAKLDDPVRAVALFASWGVHGGWVIATAGWVEVILGLALLNRPTRPLGALGLSIWMLLWGTIQLLARSSAVAASVGVLALMMLYLTAWRATLRPQGVRLSKALRPDGPWLESPLEPEPNASVAMARRLVRSLGSPSLSAGPSGAPSIGWLFR